MNIFTVYEFKGCQGPLHADVIEACIAWNVYAIYLPVFFAILLRRFDASGNLLGNGDESTTTRVVLSVDGLVS